MQQIALIFACLSIGALLRASGQFPDSATRVFGGWVIKVALPAAAIHNVHGLTMRPNYWIASLTPWIGVALAIVIIVPLCVALRWSRQRAGALLLVAGWGNTSFVGLPMIAAFAGSQWLGLGIAIDLFGSYLALSTLGLGIAMVASSGRIDWRAMVKRIATFPPFIAILIAFATIHTTIPEWLMQVVASLADTLTPVALAAVGFALRLDRLSGRIGAIAAGLGFRLFLAPLALALLYRAFGHADDPAAKVAVLEMAMPPMLGASIIAIDHNLESDLVTLLIGIGVPLSMLTAWGWWSAISAL